MVKVIKEIKNTDIFYSLESDTGTLENETQYLIHKKKVNASPNTVRRIAYSLLYYLGFLERNNLELGDVFNLSYSKQHEHFYHFLQYIKNGEHTDRGKVRKNISCNMYLGDVLRYYQYLSLEYENYGKLKVLKNSDITITNKMGVKKKIDGKTFKGYLPNDKKQGETLGEDKLFKLVGSCTNCRDQLILLMIAETGFRVGEVLGIDYVADIDYESRAASVVGRDRNLNYARAKNQENRKGYFSERTFKLLMAYISKYKDILKNTTSLFVVISGEHIGKPLKVSAVYSMLRRLEKKTRIDTHPHAIRHYFANERWKSGWDLLLISTALGHKSIQTTINYLNVGSEELRSAAEDYYRNNNALNMIGDLL
ncbi:MAG: tyrosine-type recombinase/integrase [Clostridiales bacterium]|nr:tyrosine-type recombinase/integrase [Clostridiales bacterium]